MLLSIENAFKSFKAIEDNNILYAKFNRVSLSLEVKGFIRVTINKHA